MKYRHGDTVVEGSTPKAVVEAMRASSYESSRTLREYMIQVSNRLRAACGSDGVRVDTEENFVTDLVAGGFLEEVDRG